MTYSNGEKYDGEWRSGKREGKGILLFPNGDKYQGEFRDDQVEGKGILFQMNGDKYEGKEKPFKNLFSLQVNGEEERKKEKELLLSSLEIEPKDIGPIISRKDEEPSFSSTVINMK